MYNPSHNHFKEDDDEENAHMPPLTRATKLKRVYTFVIKLGFCCIFCIIVAISYSMILWVCIQNIGHGEMVERTMGETVLAAASVFLIITGAIISVAMMVFVVMALFEPTCKDYDFLS